MAQQSGTAPLAFTHRPDLHTLPSEALPHETKLHTSFATDTRPGHNDRYYALRDVGLLRISPDLQQHTLIPLANNLKAMNFHSLRFVEVDGEPRLICAADEAGQVIVLALDGTLQRTFGRPLLPPYADPNTPYKPTDTALVDDKLYIADGYGADYISVLDLQTEQWLFAFGGHTEDRNEDGRFRTAHNLVLGPDGEHLIIVDRWNSRLQFHALNGDFVRSQRFPYNAWLCNIDFVRWQGRHLGVIACLYDVDNAKERPAPIYIVDGASFEILSTIRPKEDLGIERAQRMHNAVWHLHDDQLFIICHCWNPGQYIVLELMNK